LVWNEGSGKWLYFDDDDVEVVDNKDDFIRENSELYQSYLLFYKRESGSEFESKLIINIFMILELS
jgi:hypothetical protein